MNQLDAFVGFLLVGLIAVSTGFALWHHHGAKHES
jgi:hypothetical protein